MRSFWSDPYLWIHLAGFAAVPLLLELCLVGFAIGDPLLPPGLELILVAAVGIAPIVWMQWQRPFYIYSFLVVALKPEQLTEAQRRLLTLFKAPRNRILALLVPIGLLVCLRQAYNAAVIAAEVVPFVDGWRGTGLLLAASGFLGANLFTQVPVAVASVMLHRDSTVAATNPFPIDQIRTAFTLFGLRINRILPPLVSPPQPVYTEIEVPVPTSEAVVTAVSEVEETTVDTIVEPAASPEPATSEPAMPENSSPDSPTTDPDSSSAEKP